MENLKKSSYVTKGGEPNSKSILKVGLISVGTQASEKTLLLNV